MLYHSAFSRILSTVNKFILASLHTESSGGVSGQTFNGAAAGIRGNDAEHDRKRKWEHVCRRNFARDKCYRQIVGKRRRIR